MNKLEKLLFRKASIGNLLDIWAKGIKIYTEYKDTCTAVIEDEERTELERAEAKMNLHECEIPLKHYITSFKLTKRELENHVIPEIEQIASDEEKESIEFQDLEKKYSELAFNEMFTEHSKLPDNVELIKINEDIKEHISLLEQLITKGEEKILESEDEYEIAKLKLDIFKYNLQVITNKKRLYEREDYYVNYFKPKYDKDMEEADMYLELLLERAKEITKLGGSIDFKLGFMLQEYEKNKDDREKVWLFYTALKSRLKKVGKEMRRNKSQFKGHMHLSKDII